ncbi:EpsG family protein [Chelativorans sp. YIM 93263]|uniref:EpsG family protein n=1 Tax=Chelativorans sp. YIM 93263 TaxID=2906648 RepID=UPI002378E8CA|nr:EpsG family protein [Chelativorans sp. YIM 93263]
MPSTRTAERVATLATVFYFVLLTYLVGTRPESAGRDTDNYIAFFHHILEGNTGTRYEIGFRIFTASVAAFSNSEGIYLATIYAIVTLSIFGAQYLYARILDQRGRYLYFPLILSILLSSSWYIVATTNGLRQGISLSVLYIAVMLILVYRRTAYFVAISGFAALFHITAILPIPFIILFRFIPYKLSFCIFFMTAVAYALGIWRQLFYYLHIFLNINIYDSVINYADGADMWYGFQLDLFAYTLFWPIFYIIITPFIRKRYLKLFVRMLVAYMALCMPYFIFGFGPFSNRYAIIAWLFLPLLHCGFIVSSKFRIDVKWCLLIAFAFAGSYKYLSYIEVIG